MSDVVMCRWRTVKAGSFLSVLVLGGCAAHTWMPGPNVTAADFVPTQARCSMMARHGGNSIAASGPLKFVVAEQIGNAIGNAITASADFNDCMQASGFLIADGQAPRAAAYTPPAPPAPTIQTTSLPAPPRNVYLTPQNAADVRRASELPPAPTATEMPISSTRSDPILHPPTTPQGDMTYSWGVAGSFGAQGSTQ